jgi:hypothetical protein
VRPLLNALDGAVLPALLARYVAWSGDLAAAVANWDRARIAAMDARLDDDDDLALVTAAAAVTGAERLATDLGDPQLASRLLPRARDARAALQDRPLHAAARHLAACLDLLPPDSAPTIPYGSVDAELLLDTVHVLIGVQPDAARHRLWLRPRLPAGWVALSVQDIQCGDDSVRLDADLLPGLLTVRLEQDAGAIPVTALLEPFVPGAVSAVRVDGRPASLAPRAVEGGTRVPVQLVLDPGADAGDRVRRKRAIHVSGRPPAMCDVGVGLPCGHPSVVGQQPSQVRRAFRNGRTDDGPCVQDPFVVGEPVHNGNRRAIAQEQPLGILRDTIVHWTST